jgi:hypothetical protein
MIVESPTKAHKIQKFLGDTYQVCCVVCHALSGCCCCCCCCSVLRLVLSASATTTTTKHAHAHTYTCNQVIASYGHVRDLLNKQGAVRPDEGFALTWNVSSTGVRVCQARRPAVHVCMRGAPAAAAHAGLRLTTSSPLVCTPPPQTRRGCVTLLQQRSGQAQCCWQPTQTGKGRPSAGTSHRSCRCVLDMCARVPAWVVCVGGTALGAETRPPCPRCCCCRLHATLKRRGVLRPGQALQRVTFTEVTQKAVREALQHPRQVRAADARTLCSCCCVILSVSLAHSLTALRTGNTCAHAKPTNQPCRCRCHALTQVSGELVDAYLARRALDYLLGFSVSPLLWRRLGPAAKSAGGRVRGAVARPELQLPASSAC